ncbi:hypothetical protein PGTUg99_037190 [Puccinia graminis f. sp. tritici]|uniref:Uncharacterized protein n=1 Tax=Puccinia graminis f. sp. tritici TaxID=56615 RepID=A0A5B0S2H2_PUCGR|nr:hypothetical protein PGTUg99_037190 [Puccinia graminis f. sp. tritici]
MARPKLPAEDISSESRQPSSRLFTIGILVPNIGMSFRVPRPRFSVSGSESSTKEIELQVVLLLLLHRPGQ